MRVFSAFTLFLSIAAFTSTFFIFALVYHRLWLLYLEKLSQGVWEPAWPVTRAHWVIFVATVPIWGAIMSLSLLVSGPIRIAFQWIMGRRKQDSKLYEQLPMDLTEYTDEDEVAMMSTTSTAPVVRRRITLLRFYLCLTFIGASICGSYQCRADTMYKTAIKLAARTPKVAGYGKGEKIYIAAMFYNNQDVLPYWSEEMLKVVHYLGPDNVFVSIVESHSDDSSPHLIEEFDATLAMLGVSRSIKVQDTSIPRPISMDTAPARIQYLSSIRNLVMQPLSSGNIGTYDKVLFSNDIFIEADSVIELLNTNQGDYDMVCGLDLSYWGLYDSWVTRDSKGRIVSSLWPYFREDAGMAEVMQDDPVPVFACWNGIVAIRADPFLPIDKRNGTLSHESLQLPSTHPSHDAFATSPSRRGPLEFRSSGPDECFSSESFLLPYDLRRMFGMNEIYLNPRVINSYTWNFYIWFKYVTRHWIVRWWMKHVENHSVKVMDNARMVLWHADKIWTWDGGECQPWS